MSENIERTNQLPSDIKAISKSRNLYESYDIKKAGYRIIQKIRLRDNNNLTIWKNIITGNTLIFIEKQGGLYQFGGYAKEKRDN